MQERKRVDRTRNSTYLRVLHHASLVAVGAPHYLMEESLVNYARIMVDTTSSLCPSGTAGEKTS